MAILWNKVYDSVIIIIAPIIIIISVEGSEALSKCGTIMLIGTFVSRRSTALGSPGGHVEWVLSRDDFWQFLL